MFENIFIIFLFIKKYIYNKIIIKIIWYLKVMNLILLIFIIIRFIIIEYWILDIIIFNININKYY